MNLLIFGRMSKWKGKKIYLREPSSETLIAYATVEKKAPSFQSRRMEFCILKAGTYASIR